MNIQEINSEEAEATLHKRDDDDDVDVVCLQEAVTAEEMMKIDFFPLHFC